MEMTLDVVRPAIPVMLGKATASIMMTAWMGFFANFVKENLGTYGMMVTIVA